MSTEGPTSRWLDDLALDDEPPPAGRRRHRGRALLVGATAPWLVVGVVLVGAHLRDGGDHPAGSAPDAPAAMEDAADGDALAPVGDGVIAGRPDDPSGGHAPAGTQDLVAATETGAEPEAADGAPHTAPGPGRDGLHLVELRGDWRVEAGVEEAAALAVVLARAWLTDLEPALHIDGVTGATEGEYAEHLVVESIERPAPDLSVVTVVAVVLESSDGLAADVRRLAVPITWADARPRPGGAPWLLPPPDLEPHPLPTEEITDPAVLDDATDAFARAGYTEVELRSLHRTDAGAVVADVRASVGQGGEVDGPVWLRRHLDGFVVAGMTLSAGGTP